MCQMCDEYENELIRMGLVAEARKAREERHGRKEISTVPADKRPADPKARA